MISSDKGEIKIVGQKLDIMADLGLVINTLYQEKFLTQKEIEIVLKTVFLSEDEIDKEIEKMKKIEKELLGGSNYDF